MCVYELCISVNSVVYVTLKFFAYLRVSKSKSALYQLLFESIALVAVAHFKYLCFVPVLYTIPPNI